MDITLMLFLALAVMVALAVLVTLWRIALERTHKAERELAAWKARAETITDMAKLHRERAEEWRAIAQRTSEVDRMARMQREGFIDIPLPDDNPEAGEDTSEQGESWEGSPASVEGYRPWTTPDPIV